MNKLKAKCDNDQQQTVTKGYMYTQDWSSQIETENN